jgi:HNH endonuclease
MPSKPRPPIPIATQVRVLYRDGWLCSLCGRPTIFHLALKYLDEFVHTAGYEGPTAYFDPRWRRDSAPLLDELACMIDHVEAYASGGAHEESNFAVACARCNAVPGNYRKLLNIHGVGPKTVSFLKLLVGLDAIAVDIHIQRFVREAGVDTKDPEVIEVLLTEAGRQLGFSAAEVDQLIWRFMAGREHSRRKPKISGRTADSVFPLSEIERHFHALIEERAGALATKKHVDLPSLAGTRPTRKNPAWFPVPGMYGGFKYWWQGRGSQLLIAESWCRVVSGSGQRHQITSDGPRLLEEGFV